jgi:hypothetical protein
MLPVGATAFHLGPGQDHAALDQVASLIVEGEAFAKEGRALIAADSSLAAAGAFTRADQAFSDALAQLPPDRVAESQAIRVERAKCLMFLSKLPEANRDLTGLVAELAADPNADPKVLADARSTYANSQYYMTWLMRLEGAGRDKWEPRIESARQTFKLLAEQADDAGDAEQLARHREDLESAIRLARMDLTELQGLPLPSQ